MLPQRRPNSDRSGESLEARLRALPPEPIPGDLEARLLAAIPVQASNEIPRLARTARRLAVWAGAAAAVAAACLLAVVLWPGTGVKNPVHSLVAKSEKRQLARQDTSKRSGDSRSIMPWLEIRRDPDGTEMPTFTWPVQEESPLMVSTSIPPDLFD
jgi:hypothetical protein